MHTSSSPTPPSLATATEVLPPGSAVSATAPAAHLARDPAGVAAAVLTDPAANPIANSTADPRADLRRVIERFGGRLLDGPQGPECVFDETPQAAWPAGGAICPLPDYGRLAVSGADATSFLQNQLTNDVATLADNEARWTGYCSPKGRLLTTALNWREPERFLLAVARAQAETLRKRLSMFVLRAKAKVIDDSAGFLAVGLLGPAIEPVLRGLDLPRPGEPMAVSHRGVVSAIALPPVEMVGTADGKADGATQTVRSIASVSIDRVMLWLPLTGPQAEESLAALQATAAAAGNNGDTAGDTSGDASENPFADSPPRPVLASTALWRWTEVMVAVPRLFPASSELFVPQMINFEAVGGVNFKKGCYPGQEIVARSQYLGKLKRRMFRGHLAATPGGIDDGALPAPGQDVSPLAGGEPSGQVVLSAAAPGGGVDVLFESQIAAVENGGVAIGGRPVRIDPLPYEVKR